MANGTVFSSRLRQPAGHLPSFVRKYKINQSKKKADSLLVICFDDFEVKTNDILREDHDFIFSVQLAVTCEGILNRVRDYLEYTIRYQCIFLTSSRITFE